MQYILKNPIHTLFAAAAAGNQYLVDIIISHIENSGRQMSRQWTYAMMHAALNNHAGLENFFRVKIEKQRRLDSQDDIIMVLGAASYGNIDLIEFYIQRRASYGARACLWHHAMKCAAFNGHESLVHYCISQIQVNQDQVTHEKFPIKWNKAMHAAAAGGHKNLVMFFVTKIEESQPVEKTDWEIAKQTAHKRGEMELVEFFDKKLSGL